jgi:hypothetical protein
MNCLTTRGTRLGAILLITLLVIAVATIGSAPVLASGPIWSTASAVLPAGGGWVAYNFPYPGDNSNVGVTLTYSPVDGNTNAEGAVTLDAYSPTDPNLQGGPIGSASWTAPGKKYWQFSSKVSGNYLVIVHNWDPQGRPVEIHVTTINVDTGCAGPGLSFVSTSVGAPPKLPPEPCPPGQPPMPPEPCPPGQSPMPLEPNQTGPVETTTNAIPLPGGGSDDFNFFNWPIPGLNPGGMLPFNLNW